jgi:hypothetical protein
LRLWDFLDAELFEMFVNELRIEKFVAKRLQPCAEMHQCNLAGVGAHRKHALAEEGRAE